MVRRGKKEVLAHQLSRRERQIMTAVYRKGQATVSEVVASIPDPPSSDAVRRLCHILEEKGLLRARRAGTKNVFSPTVHPRTARRSALENLLDTFFGGSAHSLVAALLDARRDELSDEDLARLTEMIESAGKEGRGP